MSVSVGIVAEDDATLDRVARALRRRGLSVAAIAADGEALGRECAEQPPDAVVLAGEVERERRAATIRLLSDRLPGTALIVVSPSSSRNGARGALSAGAVGYVLESQVEEALAPTVLAGRAGQVSVPRELQPLLEKPMLTRREKQILAMVVLGYTNHEIGSKLHVAETTVKSHLSSAFKKLGVRSRKEAIDTILDPQEGLGAGILTISEQG